MSSIFKTIKGGSFAEIHGKEPEDANPLLGDDLVPDITGCDSSESTFDDVENYTIDDDKKEVNFSDNKDKFRNNAYASVSDGSYEFLQIPTSEQYIPCDIREVDSRSILRLGSSLGVIGPKLISKEQYGKHKLGSGSLFEVYGHNQSSYTGKTETQNAEWEGFDVNTIVFKKGYVALKRNKYDNEETTWWSRSRTNTISIHKDGSAKNQQQEQRQIDAIIREMVSVPDKGVCSDTVLKSR